MAGKAIQVGGEEGGKWGITGFTVAAVQMWVQGCGTMQWQGMIVVRGEVTGWKDLEAE